MKVKILNKNQKKKNKIQKRNMNVKHVCISETHLDSNPEKVTVKD